MILNRGCSERNSTDFYRAYVLTSNILKYHTNRLGLILIEPM